MSLLSANWNQTGFCQSCTDTQAPLVSARAPDRMKLLFYQWQFNRSGPLFFICCSASGGPSMVDSKLNPDGAKNICLFLQLLCSHIVSDCRTNEGILSSVHKYLTFLLCLNPGCSTFTGLTSSATRVIRVETSLTNCLFFKHKKIACLSLKVVGEVRKKGVLSIHST